MPLVCILENVTSDIVIAIHRHNTYGVYWFVWMRVERFLRITLKNGV